MLKDNNDATIGICSLKNDKDNFGVKFIETVTDGSYKYSGQSILDTALQNSFEGNGEPEPIDGFTAAQRFYLSYATIWGQNIRDEEAARLTKVDVHSLGKNRVNATLRNVATFYEAFGITDGAMFLPEEERVVIW